jgi:hypothetical protein
MEARPNLRRLLTCAAALVALVALTSACGGSSDAQAAAKKDSPRAKYADRYLSFSYPAAWKASTPTGPTEFHFHPLVYLSTQPVGSPCSTNGSETDCGWPVKRLQPGGVLILWQLPYTLPGAGLASAPGKAVHVGGAPAKRLDTAGGACREIGADRTIDTLIRTRAEGFVEFTACLRGPGLARAEKSVDALLRSAKLLSQ